ncbi:MAG: thiamine ABC transporter substrate-binding protein, partial [Anaerolinea sp.]|nr:thiamine ABC transporter substrate-binding protein [Anaerolinea sp.]
MITVLLALLGGAAVAQPTSGTVITVIAHDSFAYSESVMGAFTEQTGIGVEVIRLGDAGSLVNQSILSRSNPLGDVLFGVDNTFLSRALDADIFIPYRSPEIERVIPDLRPSDDDRVTPITFGDVCLNYDAAFFAETGLDLPQNLADLTQPEYRSLLAVQNPALSSPGLAFLLLTVAVFGEESEYTYLDFWADPVENDVYVSPVWTDAYYNQF